MAKTKISELVKKYGVESKEILDCLHEMVRQNRSDERNPEKE